MSMDSSPLALPWRPVAVGLALSTLPTMWVAGSADVREAFAGSVCTCALFAAVFVVLHRYRHLIEPHERGVMWSVLIPTAIFFARCIQLWNQQ